jgi:hypothetical protein
VALGEVPLVASPGSPVEGVLRKVFPVWGPLEGVTWMGFLGTGSL